MAVAVAVPAEEAAAGGGRRAEVLSERLRTMPENHEPPPAEEDAGADAGADGEDEEREDGGDRFISGCLCLLALRLRDGGGNEYDGMEIRFKFTFGVVILLLM